MTTRRNFNIKIALTSASAVLALVASSHLTLAQAQTTMSKPVKIIVGFPPGGSAEHSAHGATSAAKQRHSRRPSMTTNSNMSGVRKKVRPPLLLQGLGGLFARMQRLA